MTHEIMRSLGRIEATLEAQKEVIADIAEGVSDYRRMKNRIIGACVVVSSVVGVAWACVLKRIGGT